MCYLVASGKDQGLFWLLKECNAHDPVGDAKYYFFTRVDLVILSPVSIV